jgi:PAS domain S-box-containing protein
MDNERKIIVDERLEREQNLKEALEQTANRQAETEALLQATRAVMAHHRFEDAARDIFDACRGLIGAPAGYISLLNEAGTENEVAFFEAGGYPCTVDPALPMPIRGFREVAYRAGEVLYHNNFAQSEFVEFLPAGHVRLDNVMFAPLMLKGEPVGLLGLSNKPGGFTPNDARLAAGFAELAAVALVSKRAEEALRQAHDELERRVEERTADLSLANEQLLWQIQVRQQVEEALQEQSRILEAFFQHTINPLVFLDRQFNFIRVNEAYARVCQREVSEFPGRNHFDLYPHAENQAIFAKVVQSKTPHQAIAKSFVFPDHPEWGVTYWDWTLAPILDEQGGVDFLVFALNDVTQRVLAEEHKAQLVEIIEATPDFVGAANLDGGVLFINKAGREMLGVGVQDDLSCLSIRDFHPPETVRFILSEALPAARREGVWRGETVFLAKNGREIPTSQIMHVHKAPDGGDAFYSTIAHDISDLKQAEHKLRMLTSQLLKAQEIERRRLSRELHDEMGQSLMVLKMQVGALERKLPPGQEALQEDCRRALKYIDEIIDNVRRLSRDLSPSLLEDLGLSAALNHLFDEFGRHQESMQFVVEQESVDELAPKDAQINIFRIFQESLTNIAKHAQASQVRVSLKKQGDVLLGVVEDDGAGFEVAAVLARHGYDRGLGLAAMYERLRILGGTLHIDSEPGKGTRISFTVPLGEGEAGSWDRLT